MLHGIAPSFHLLPFHDQFHCAIDWNPHLAIGPRCPGVRVQDLMLLTQVFLKVHSGIDLKARLGRNGRFGFNECAANVAVAILLTHMPIQQPDAGMNEGHNNSKYGRSRNDGRELHICPLMFQLFSASLVFHMALWGTAFGSWSGSSGMSVNARA